MKLFDAYFEHLAQTPERIDGLLMWTLCSFICWFMLWKYRERIIVGLEGTNLLWESSEIVVFMFMWMMPPIVFFAAFIKDIPLAVWYFMAFGIGFALLGRQVLDYGLAFLGRAPLAQPKKEEGATVTTETTTTVKP